MINANQARKNTEMFKAKFETEMQCKAEALAEFISEEYIIKASEEGKTSVSIPLEEKAVEPFYDKFANILVNNGYNISLCHGEKLVLTVMW